MRGKPCSHAHLDAKSSPGPARLVPTGTAALALLSALVLTLALASRADAAASVSVSGSTLKVTAGAGTTDNLGISANLRVTNFPSEGPSNPIGVAVDSGHVYWTNVDTGTIGRANLNGAGVNDSFITGVFRPEGVAVDSGHVYWAGGGFRPNTIGRANLDGTGVNRRFIAARDGYTGSVVAPGAGCQFYYGYDVIDHDRAVYCYAPGGITRIIASVRDQSDRVVNATALPSSLYGGAGGDTLIGGSAKDTLGGRPGADVLKGLGGNDLLSARDLRSDTTIDCGAGSDKADLDLLPKDPDSKVTDCETKTRH